MSEKKLDRMEGILTQLVSMVAKMNERQNAMESTINSMKSDMGSMNSNIDSMKSDMGSMKGDIQQLNNKLDKLEEKGEQRYQEIKDQLTFIRADQNLTWQKAVHNERDVAKLKGIQFGT